MTLIWTLPSTNNASAMTVLTTMQKAFAAVDGVEGPESRTGF